MSDARVDRLRRLVLVLVFVLVFGAVAAPVTVIVAVQQSNSSTLTEINCVTLEAGLLEVRAINANRIILTRMARTLGVPIVFPPPLDLPEVPAECDGT